MKKDKKTKKIYDSVTMKNSAGQNSSFIVFCWGMLGLSSTPKTKSSFFALAVG